jgi:hypothetical protein
MWLNYRAPAQQAQGPEFKPQDYQKKKIKKKRKNVTASKHDFTEALPELFYYY